MLNRQFQDGEGLPSRPHRTRKPSLLVRPRLCPGARRPWIQGYAETNDLEQVKRLPPSPPLHGSRVDQEYNLPCADVESPQLHPGQRPEDENYSEGTAISARTRILGTKIFAAKKVSRQNYFMLKKSAFYYQNCIFSPIWVNLNLILLYV